MDPILPPGDGFEPHHASSPTDRFIYEMQVHGYRPFQDEPDPRPLPEEPVVRASLTTIFDALFEMLGDTRLEPDLEDLSGRSPISFTVPASASSASSIATRRRSALASANRMARRSRASSSSASSPRASRCWNVATASSLCAMFPAICSRRKPGPPGGRAPAPRSATQT